MVGPTADEPPASSPDCNAHSTIPGQAKLNTMPLEGWAIRANLSSWIGWTADAICPDFGISARSARGFGMLREVRRGSAQQTLSCVAINNAKAVSADDPS